MSSLLKIINRLTIKGKKTKGKKSYELQRYLKRQVEVYPFYTFSSLSFTSFHCVITSCQPSQSTEKSRRVKKKRL